MKVSVDIGYYYFKVLIDDIPHVVVETKELKGFHSWNDTENHYCIEWVTKTNKFKTEYDSMDKWKQILKALNESI